MSLHWGKKKTLKDAWSEANINNNSEVVHILEDHLEGCRDFQTDLKQLGEVFDSYFYILTNSIKEIEDLSHTNPPKIKEKINFLIERELEMENIVRDLQAILITKEK